METITTKKNNLSALQRICFENNIQYNKDSASIKKLTERIAYDL